MGEAGLDHLQEDDRRYWLPMSLLWSVTVVLSGGMVTRQDEAAVPLTRSDYDSVLHRYWA